MMGHWSGLAIAPDGDLWVGGRYSAGKIVYTELAAGLGPDGKPDVNSKEGWYQRPGSVAFSRTFGNPWCGSAGMVKKWIDGGWQMSSCSPNTGDPPVFRPAWEGDPVNINAVAVAPDGKVWWTSAQYGIASLDGYHFTYYEPSQASVPGTITDMVVLPDGRLAIGADGGGVTFWDPASGAHTSIRGGSGLLDDRVNRLELDMMVKPPALHVSTRSGAATIRVLP